MTEQSRFWRHVAAQPQPNIAETVKSIVREQVFGRAVCRGTGLRRLNCRQLSIDRTEIVKQKAQRFHLFSRSAAGVYAVEGGIKVHKCPLEMGIVLVGLA